MDMIREGEERVWKEGKLRLLAMSMEEKREKVCGRVTIFF